MSETMLEDEFNVETKALGPPTVINAGLGQIEAIVATLDTVDRDRDVIPLDAFPTGIKVKMSGYGHSSIAGLMYSTGIADAAPVGKGAIFIEGDKAVFRGQYFMDTVAGKEAFLTTQGMGAEQEWSFGYRILKTEKPSESLAAKGARRILAKLGPLEVSPVLYAGGVGTRTVATKAAEDAATVSAAEAEAEAKAAVDAKTAAAAITQEAAAHIAHRLRATGEALKQRR